METAWGRIPIGYISPLDSEDLEEKRLCEEYLSNPPSSIPQQQIWYLLRTFGKRLGYMVRLD